MVPLMARPIIKPIKPIFKSKFGYPVKIGVNKQAKKNQA